MEATGWSQAAVVAATCLPEWKVSEAPRSARAVPPEVLDEAAAGFGGAASLFDQVLVRLRERTPVDVVRTRSQRR